MTAAATVHLLTYRPEQMLTWWAALLGVTEVPPSHERAVVVRSPTLNVVVERSELALDHHREACGVTTIAITPADVADTLAALDRLADIEAQPHRATRHPGFTRLWFRDPNGAEVAIDVQSDGADAMTSYDPLFPLEVDPRAVVANLRRRGAR